VTTIAAVYPGARATRRPSSYATSHRIEEVDLTLPGGRRVALLLKHLGRGSLVPAARGAKPSFLDDPLRELEVYRRVLTPLDLGTPRLHAAAEPTDRSGGWLLLERVDGSPLWQLGDLAGWDSAARWLAVFHRESARLLPPPASSRLLVCDADYFALWPARAARLQSSRSRAERARLRWLRRGWPAVVDRLCALPPAIVHGEFYPSNVLVAGERVCPVDWELAAIGPAALDLAALVSGGWSAGDRRRLVEGYHQAAGAAGGSRSLDELVQDVGHAQLHVCMQWLGWTAGWQPPPEHERDWLVEAVALAEELGW
jgi:aminoglycoside phosphotransferase (APT) family kinase protein